MGPTVRRKDYDFPSAVPPDWAGSAFLTHLMDAFNLMAPAGEGFLIRVTREHLHAADEPFFREVVKAFVGQEAQHARQHRRYLEGLASRGFPVEDFDAWWQSVFVRLRDRLSPEMQLAVVAAMEHFAAVVGELGLRSSKTAGVPDPFRALLEWHAAEEIEHKDVAFDLLQRVEPDHRLRAKGLVVAAGVLFVGYSRAMMMLMRHEGSWWRWSTWAQMGQLYWGRDRFASRWMSALRAYLRADFHPRQHTADLPLAARALARHRAMEAPFPPSGNPGIVGPVSEEVGGD